jgi:hypothetical protein
MELIAPLPELVTAAAVISATRPTTIAHGVSIASWIQGGRFAFPNCTAFIQGDGANRTITSPTGGAAGVEVWTWKNDAVGVGRWWLVGYLDGGATVVVIDPGGWAQLLEGVAIGTRLCISGTPSGGAPTYFFEPIEHAIDARRQ